MDKGYIKLKHCPFCGGKAEVIHKSTGYTGNPTTILDEFVAGCMKCDIYTPCFKCKIWLDSEGELHNECNGAEKAAEAWNRRADHDQR